MPKSRKPSSSEKKDKSPRPKKASESVGWTSEYEEYLERYAEFGKGRPRLKPEEFDKLDDELLDLLDLAGELTDEQVIRLQELEYLLIDTE